MPNDMKIVLFTVLCYAFGFFMGYLANLEEPNDT